MAEDVNEKIIQFEILYERVCKYLNVFNLLLNSKVIMAEMTENEDVMLLMIKLLMSRSPYISYLSS
jgi:hypothetical protein